MLPLFHSWSHHAFHYDVGIRHGEPPRRLVRRHGHTACTSRGLHLVVPTARRSGARMCSSSGASYAYPRRSASRSTLPAPGWSATVVLQPGRQVGVAGPEHRTHGLRASARRHVAGLPAGLQAVDRLHELSDLLAQPALEQPLSRRVLRRLRRHWRRCHLQYPPLGTRRSASPGPRRPGRTPWPGRV